MKFVILLINYLISANSFIHSNFNRKLHNKKLITIYNDNHHNNFYLSQAVKVFDSSILEFLKKKSQLKYNYIDVKNNNIYNYTTFCSKYKYLKKKKTNFNFTRWNKGILLYGNINLYERKL